MKVSKLINDSRDKKDLKQNLGTELKKFKNLPGSEKIKTGYKRELFKEIVYHPDYPTLLEKDRKLNIKEKEIAIKNEFKDELIYHKSFDKAKVLWDKNQAVLKNFNHWNGIFGFISHYWQYEYGKYMFSKEELLNMQKSFNMSDDEFNAWVEYLICNLIRNWTSYIPEPLAYFENFKTSPIVISAFKENIINKLPTDIRSNYYSSDAIVRLRTVVVDIDTFLKSPEVQAIVKKSVLDFMKWYTFPLYFDVNSLEVFWLVKRFRESGEIQEDYKKAILERLESCYGVQDVYKLLIYSGLGEDFLKMPETIHAIKAWIMHYSTMTGNFREWDPKIKDMPKSLMLLKKMLD